ncbi:LysR family transcriptional regulator [Pseudoalteromonas sp. R3]|uniref:LysR family transcriptional regulator n=1 Tax=Pseudoalteromonas sp. R3 TaxID=1709477 RepID=UPI0006B5A99E|nr:LysR family transcriptional regulator [Pseudoalteromonas sp. R3]AZZ97149.1 LysR family transcriptional regulator [Pseudoalteromonas sp. R3]
MIERSDLQWLLSFLAVYEQLSFKRAAQQRQLPTSNVSRHVALLEQHLNIRLLERTTRKMRPTAAGTRLYQTLKPLTLAMNDALVEVSQQSSQLSGHLKIVIPDLPILAELITHFCQLHPDIQLSCDTQLNPTEGVLEGFDMIVRFDRGTLEDSGWVAKTLLHFPSCVVASPELITSRGLPDSLDMLSKMPCISSFTVLQGAPWRFKGNKTLHLPSRYKVNSGHMAKAAALKGLGFAILPEHACEAEIAAGTLVKVPLDHEPEDLILYAFYSGRKYPQKKVTALLSHIKQGLTM